MEDEQKDKGFVIKDRRLFDETGEVRDAKKDAEAARAKEAGPAAPEEPAPAAGPEPEEAEGGAYLPEVNFANFVISLGTTVMYHLGDFPDPVTQKSVKNLQAAKHAIDTIGMLKAKTAGNLDQDEASLIDGLLFELRMRYVKEAAPK